MYQPEVMACGESSHILGLMPTMKAGRGCHLRLSHLIIRKLRTEGW